MKPKRHARLELAPLVVGLAMLLARAGAAGATERTAELSPSAIALDQAAELRVAADDGRSPALPTVDGLTFQRTGQTTEMSSINGQVSQHTWIVYQVVAAHPGAYAIPLAGQTLRLSVGPAGATRSSAQPTGGFASPSGSATQPGSLALFRVVLPNRKLYVGQAAPIAFKAYFRPGVQVTLTGPPSLGIAAFTINQLADAPKQSVESIGGVPYRVATWTGQISAAMPGRYATSSTLPIDVRYREASRRPARDPFAGMLEDDDDLPASSLLRSMMSRSQLGGGFDDLFGEVRERQLTLRAAAQPIEVLPLPANGRPADFSGAVGHFDVRATLAPSAGTAFEPMRLKIEVSGQGNFDRVSTGGLPTSRQWKSYPPSAAMTPAGTKIFEQAVVPEVSGSVALPALSFSFFDPDRRQYVTRSTAPIAVEVVPAPGGTAALAPVSEADSPRDGQRAASRLGANRLDEGRYVATLLPPYRRPWFWLALAIPFGALVIVLARAGGARRLSTRARRRALRNTIDERRAEMRRAAVAKDPVRFFESARSALQERLAARWGIAPDDVTSTEAESRMGEVGAAIVDALQTAEHLRYGGGAPLGRSLAEYDETIERQLDQLENQP